MKPEPETPDRPDPRQMRGEGEGSYERAKQAPEDTPEATGEEPNEKTRRDDISVPPEDLAARFLSDAVQGDPSPDEEGAEIEEELPVAEDEDDLRDRSRADLPPDATPEGERR